MRMSSSWIGFYENAFSAFGWKSWHNCKMLIMKFQFIHKVYKSDITIETMQTLFL